MVAGERWREKDGGGVGMIGGEGTGGGIEWWRTRIGGVGARGEEIGGRIRVVGAHGEGMVADQDWRCGSAWIRNAWWEEKGGGSEWCGSEWCGSGWCKYLKMGLRI